MNLNDVMSLVLLFYTTQDQMPELYCLPPLQKEHAALVEQMGDDRFAKREEADKQLREAGYKALRPVWAGMKHKDLEIARRCERIYNDYMSVCSEDKDNCYPSIWTLDNDTRFLKGVKIEKHPEAAWGGQVVDEKKFNGCKPIDTNLDVSHKYFQRARAIINHERSKQQPPAEPLSEISWHDTGCTQLATQLYIRDMLIQGKKREDVRATLNGMAKTTKECVQLPQYEKDAEFSANYQYPPGPSVPLAEFAPHYSMHP